MTSTLRETGASRHKGGPIRALPFKALNTIVLRWPDGLQGSRHDAERRQYLGQLCRRCCLQSGRRLSAVYPAALHTQICCISKTTVDC